MFFQRLKTPGLGHDSYVLGCGDGLAVVIDPRRSATTRFLAVFVPLLVLGLLVMAQLAP